MPKCPKCQYFSFDSGDRCRNCGYEFSLASTATIPDLSLRPDRYNNDVVAFLGMRTAQARLHLDRQHRAPRQPGRGLERHRSQRDHG